MARPYRKERLDELLLRELESIICYELEDPRLRDVTVTAVDVTRDLQTARVYVALLDENGNERAVLDGLEHARGYVRSQIAGRLQLRRVPDLVFRIDRQYAAAARVDTILDALNPSTGPESMAPADPKTP
jgi:ribosome-binding factor A